MAPRTETGTVPRPPAPGTEMDALVRFHPDVTWTGKIEPGGMGPGTPEMSAVGRGRHRLIQGGRWIVGDYEQDQMGADGQPILKWELHWVAGWDPTNAEYRATLADNYGHADVMRGHIDGDTLVFETVGPAHIRLRLVWDASNQGEITWTNKMSREGGPWELVETYHLVPG